MKRSVEKIALVLAAAALLGGCNPFKKDEPKTPVVGERISVLTGETDIEIDQATAALPFSLPAAVANEEWTQSGGNPAKSMGHLALGSSLGTAWSVSIGAGNNRSARLASAPVIGGGRLYHRHGRHGARLRHAQRRPGVEHQLRRRCQPRPITVAAASPMDGRVYASNGGYVAALDAATGGAAWTVKPGGPLRGSPTAAGDAVYVMSQDNQIYSLKTADGAQNWSSAAALEIAGVFGSGSPAVAAGTVVAGFSSGELNAYRYENGRQVWQDALSRTSMSTSVAALSDIDADPVIDGGQVFASARAAAWSRSN